MTLPISGRRALLGAAASGLFAAPTLAQERTLRIGFQKYGTLVLLKGRGTLDARLRGEGGVRVSWTEFPSGPALLEAMNVGAIDLGTVGEAPPIFAQAAGAPLLYVAHEPPAPQGERSSSSATARSGASPIFAARRSPSTRAPTSITLWSAR